MVQLARLPSELFGEHLCGHLAVEVLERGLEADVVLIRQIGELAKIGGGVSGIWNFLKQTTICSNQLTLLVILLITWKVVENHWKECKYLMSHVAAFLLVKCEVLLYYVIIIMGPLCRSQVAVKKLD